MANKWRLIQSKPASGAVNMALDEAILEAVGKKQSPPTLRLYSWKPYCLSLGYAQPFSDVNIKALEDLQWDVVRRPTGGRAILHADELTYSIITHQSEPEMEGGILESYRRLSQGLLAALRLLNLSANADKEYDLPEGSHKNAPVCFEVPSNYEITVSGKKIIGSAQARRMDGVLQHGSLPLFGNITRIVQVLNVFSEGKKQEFADKLLVRATTVETALGGEIVTWEKAAESFVTGFTQALSICFEESIPSPQELHRSEQLTIEKYSHPSWTKRL